MNCFRHYKFAIPTTLLFVVLTVAGQALAQKPPITGTAVPEFAPLDDAMLAAMNVVQCQAGLLAISRDDKVLYSRGYGWSDHLRKQPTQPDSMMRIGFATNAITAAAIRHLIDDDKLSLDTKVFPFLKLPAPPRTKPDSRLAQITVENLLEHKGGWDRAETFDPMGKVKEIEQYFQLRRPAQPVDIVRFMIGQPLQYAPGERSVYSNFSHCVLGRVIEKASKKSYGKYIEEAVLKPLEIKDIKVGRNQPKDRDRREVGYPAPDYTIEILDSTGGLVATAPALCTFYDHYWMNGYPRLVGGSGKFISNGNIPYTTNLCEQRSDGYNVVALFNNRRFPDYWKDKLALEKDNGQIQKLIDDAIEKATK